MGTQLPLDITLRDEATLDRFVTGRNAELIDLLSRFEPASAQMLLISGVCGSGKSHLLQAQSRRVPGAVYLPLKQIPGMSAGIFEGLAARPLVCIDDIHAIKGIAEMELALFGLINEVKDNAHACVFTSLNAVRLVGFDLQDLVSRLNACTHYTLELPDDAHKATFLQEDARRRGLQISDDVISWVLTHLPRDMPTLTSFLALLDRESLSQQRKITIPFARDVLGRQQQ